MEELEKINIDELYNRIVILIEDAKRNVVVKVNNEMTMLYWSIGKNITENILKNKKAEYGKEVIKKLSNKLAIEYGRGYSRANLFRMTKIYEYCIDFEKISTLSRKLSWSHFVELIQISDKLKRDFYATMCSNENWSVRILRERIDSALFERTAISKKPEKTIINDLQLLSKENKMTTNYITKSQTLISKVSFVALKQRVCISKGL